MRRIKDDEWEAKRAGGGDTDGAEWEAEEIRALEPGFSNRTWLDDYPMTDVDQIKRLASALRALDL